MTSLSAPTGAAEYTDGLTMFRATAARQPERTLVHYFDAESSFGYVDDLSDLFGVVRRVLCDSVSVER